VGPVRRAADGLAQQVDEHALLLTVRSAARPWSSPLAGRARRGGTAREYNALLIALHLEAAIFAATPAGGQPAGRCLNSPA